MGEVSPDDVFTAREIALATGASEAEVVAALGGRHRRYVPHADAVRIGRLLLAQPSAHPIGAVVEPAPLFAAVLERETDRSPIGVPLALSSSAHVILLVVAAFLTTVAFAPASLELVPDTHHADPVQLVFLQVPGPGGGGGGGGLHQKADPAKALRLGRASVSSAVPRREPPRPIEPAVRPMEPPPRPLNAEPLPAVVAPVVAAPADARDRAGVLERNASPTDSHGPGSGGGAGTGTGTGLGPGDGTGIGPGSGGGTGGGPYRPGSGIQPPRLLREVKADYTEEARRRSLEGEVVLEIVVRRDGSVGDVKVLKGLGGGLDDRATQAVRQWRFAPATRLNAPVDVIVEVAVEFKLR